MESAALWISFVSAAATVAAAVVAWFARADSIKAGHEARTASERAAQATERMAQIQSRIFDGPPWEVEWFGGDSYLLTNNSPVDAHDVRIDGYPEDVVLQVGEELPWEIGAKSAVKFMFSASLGHGFLRDIIVTWRRDGSDESLTWRHPIPPRAA